jgi:hypothetical protein
MLDTDVYATLEDGPGQRRGRKLVNCVLRLTLLAPDIVEAIFDGRQRAEMGLDDMLEGSPLNWARQLQSLTQSERPSGC